MRGRFFYAFKNPGNLIIENRAWPISRQLFRTQALEHVKARQYGHSRQSVSHRILTAVFVGIALCIIAFFFLFSPTRKGDPGAGGAPSGNDRHGAARGGAAEGGDRARPAAKRSPEAACMSN